MNKQSNFLYGVVKWIDDKPMLDKICAFENKQQAMEYISIRENLVLPSIVTCTIIKIMKKINYDSDLIPLEGSRDGYGSGYGDGSGSGSGDGSGSGSIIGDGAGDGLEAGNELGFGSGSGTIFGHGSCSGDGSG